MLESTFPLQTIYTRSLVSCAVVRRLFPSLALCTIGGCCLGEVPLREHACFSFLCDGKVIGRLLAQALAHDAEAERCYGKRTRLVKPISQGGANSEQSESH